MQSLERMVADFARDQYKLDDAQVETVMRRVREGDLTMVLKAWEQDIKVRAHPSTPSDWLMAEC
jgi:nuclear-control-of-ATPase protein 2